MEILNIKNNLLKKQEAPSRQSGFTLVELMVSLTLFTIVVLAAVGSLYTVNNASRRVQAMRSVIDNLNFGLESMSRTIRTGNTVVCGGASNTTSLDPIVSANPNCSFANQNPGTNLLVDSTLGLDQLVEYQIAKPNGTGETEADALELGLTDLLADELGD
jgi:prepilin-type N-terminal cleavage/methylation domain-containing protein